MAAPLDLRPSQSNNPDMTMAAIPASPSGIQGIEKRELRLGVCCPFDTGRLMLVEESFIDRVTVIAMSRMTLTAVTEVRLQYRHEGGICEGVTLWIEIVRVSLFRSSRSALLSKLHRKLRFAFAVEPVEGPRGLFGFGMLRLKVWES